MPPIGTANQQLAPVYNQANQALQAQTPAIQNLYQALIGGLQAQQGAQVQNVVQSAEARGVGRAGLAGDVQAQLGQELALATGQLGLQQAQDVSRLGQQTGQLGVQRATSAADLAQSLQETKLQEKQARTDRRQTQRQFQLDIQKAERDFEVAKISYAKQQAAAAARAQEESLSTSQALLAVEGLWKPGGDGYVNPKQWNELRQAFMAAGYSGSTFDGEFGYLINPSHQQRDSKLPRYKGVGIRDED